MEARQILVCCAHLESGSGEISGEGSIPLASAEWRIGRWWCCYVGLLNRSGEIPGEGSIPLSSAWIVSGMM